MAITAESLNIILSARDKEFTKALDKSQKNVMKFANKSQKNLSKTSKSFDSLGNAAKKLAPLLAAAFSVSAARNAITLAKEIGNLSRLAGTSAEDFQKLAVAARTVGVDQAKLADILKDVNDKVGDFLVTGGGPMKDFFETVAPLVGVTAEQFRNLSGPQALQLYATSLEKAGANQQDFTFFLEALASDATLLAPLLRNNGKAFREMGDEAGRAGAIIKNETIDASEKLDAKLGLLGTSIQAQFTETLKGSFEGLENIAEFVQKTLLPVLGTMIGFFGQAAGLANDLVDFVAPAFGNNNIIEYEESNPKALKALIRNTPPASKDKGNTTPDGKPAGLGLGIPSVAAEVTDTANAYEDLLRSLNPIVDATLSYAEQLDTVSDAVKRGQITQGEANVTIGLARDQFDEARRSASEFASVFDTVESSLTSALMGLADGTTSVKDAFKSMAAEVIKELYRVLVVQQLVNSVTGAFGFGGASPTPSFRTRAGGGSVSAGVPYMTGESGRELFIPNQDGRILSPAQTNRAGSNDSVTVMQTINVTTGVQQTVRNEIRSMMPQISEGAKAAVLDAKRRGGSYAGGFR